MGRARQGSCHIIRESSRHLYRDCRLVREVHTKRSPSVTDRWRLGVDDPVERHVPKELIDLPAAFGRPDQESALRQAEEHTRSDRKDRLAGYSPVLSRASEPVKPDSNQHELGRHEGAVTIARRQCRKHSHECLALAKFALGQSHKFGRVNLRPTPHTPRLTTHQPGRAQ